VEVRLESHKVNLTLSVDVLQRSTKKIIYAKRVYSDNANSYFVFHAGMTYKLYLDECSQLVIDRAISDNDKNCNPISQNTLAELEYIETPRKSKNDLLSSEWHFKVDQFGIYLYINAPNEILEPLINYLLKKRINILSWDEVDDGDYRFIITFSIGFSLSRIKEHLNYFLENGAKDAQIKSLQKQMAYILDNRNRTEDIDTLQLAYEEIERLEGLLAEKTVQMEEALEHEASVFKKLKKSEIDKFLCNLLYSVYTNIAFSPNSTKVIKEKFINSKSLWQILNKLNANKEVKFKSLNGLAGKAGWKELVEHISTGNDSRGRVYFRESNFLHTYDVVVHWKKDNKEQSKTLSKLASYNYFESREVVL
jgi:hypothetical protein